MNNLATLTSNNTLELPEEIAAHFQPDERFYVWLEGNTVVLKPVKRVSLTEIVERAKDIPDEDEPTMEEINEIVHEVRRAYSVHGQ